jgi:haloacetate dehalogenase
MDQLGFHRFLVCAHDRGARVAHRLALDYADRIEKLAILDIIPTLEHFERADMAFGLGYYHWFWLAQPHPFPENIITAAPEAWFRAHTSREPKDDGFFHPDARADYLKHVHDPEMIRGMCEDYRAATTIDLVHDKASRAAGQKIACPMLVLWGAKGKIAQWYEPVKIWRDYCSAHVDGGPVQSGHYLAEEAPDEVMSRLRPFFGF